MKTKYHRGDTIQVTCKTCGTLFDYIYPGKGRPDGLNCTSCNSPERKHRRWRKTFIEGDNRVAVCIDCGNEFIHQITGGNYPRRCPDCRPIPVGTLIETVCENCHETFSYEFRKYFYKLCQSCSSILKRERNTKWSREASGAIEKGSRITTTCSCGRVFEYTLLGRRRKLCDECYNSISLPALEKVNKSGDFWNRKKWKATLAAFSYQCAYCDCNLRENTPVHRDHFIPRSLGGISEIGNIVPACRNCNLHKHDSHPLYFLSEFRYNKIVFILSQLIRSTDLRLPD